MFHIILACQFKRFLANTWIESLTLGTRRVEDGRVGFRFPVALDVSFESPPQSGLPWLRFPSPLIKPEVWISRIRLSDWILLKTHAGRQVLSALAT